MCDQQEINGWWSLYNCKDCGTEFALSDKTTKEEELVHCPICHEWMKVFYENSDFIER